MKNKNTLPLVSIIVPTYNSEKFILESVNSAINQTYTNIEIIIIDDGSTDNTETVAQQFPDSIRYIKQTNSGPSAARNHGLRESRGNYIAFLDVDDAWEPAKIEKQVSFFENNKNLMILATGYIRCDTNLKPVETVALKPTSEGIIPFKSLLERNKLLTSTIMIKKEGVNTCGFFNEKIQFGEDWDYWVRLAQLGEIGYIETPLCKYRVHGSGLTAKLDDKNMSDWLEVIEKNKQRGKNWYDKSIVYRKSLSWYLYNYSYVERVRGHKSESKRYAIKSMIIWPFSIRTLRIMKNILI